MSTNFGFEFCLFGLLRNYPESAILILLEGVNTMNRNLRKRAAVDYTYWDIGYNKPRRNRAFKNMCKKLGRKKF